MTSESQPLIPLPPTSQRRISRAVRRSLSRLYDRTLETGQWRDLRWTQYSVGRIRSEIADSEQLLATYEAEQPQLRRLRVFTRSIPNDLSRKIERAIQKEEIDVDQRALDLLRQLADGGQKMVEFALDSPPTKKTARVAGKWFARQKSMSERIVDYTGKMSKYLDQIRKEEMLDVRRERPAIDRLVAAYTQLFKIDFPDSATDKKARIDVWQQLRDALEMPLDQSSRAHTEPTMTLREALSRSCEHDLSEIEESLQRGRRSLELYQLYRAAHFDISKGTTAIKAREREIAAIWNEVNGTVDDPVRFDSLQLEMLDPLMPVDRGLSITGAS